MSKRLPTSKSEKGKAGKGQQAEQGLSKLAGLALGHGEAGV